MFKVSQQDDFFSKCLVNLFLVTFFLQQLCKIPYYDLTSAFWDAFVIFFSKPITAPSVVIWKYYMKNSKVKIYWYGKLVSFKAFLYVNTWIIQSYTKKWHWNLWFYQKWYRCQNRQSEKLPSAINQILLYLSFDKFIMFPKIFLMEGHR